MFQPKAAKDLYAASKTAYEDSIRVRLLQIEKDLNGAFYQRTEESHALVLSVLSGQYEGRGANVIMIGPPGTAKSAFYAYFTSCIENDADASMVQLFRALYHQFIKPAEVFGPENVKELLQNQKVVREMENFLANAIFAFHDEVYKANDAIRNTLLTILNEGMFQIDGQWHDVPTMCHYAASNEIGKEPAFKDRFLFWFYTPYISDRATRKEFLQKRSLPKPQVRVKLSEVYAAQKEVAKVKISDATYETFLDIVEELENPAPDPNNPQKKGKNITISDRRQRQILYVLQAEAFLQGRMETEPGDCSVLTPCLWNDPSEINTVRSTVLKKSNGQLITILELVDLVTTTFQNYVPGTAETTYDEIKKIEGDFDQIVPLPRNVEDYKKGKKTIIALRNAMNEFATKEKGRGRV